MGQSAGEEHDAVMNPDHAFSFGLERMLLGVAALIERLQEGAGA